jgi:hypothetical protein
MEKAVKKIYELDYELKEVKKREIKNKNIFPRIEISSN